MSGTCRYWCGYGFEPIKNLYEGNSHGSFGYLLLSDCGKLVHRCLQHFYSSENRSGHSDAGACYNIL